MNGARLLSLDAFRGLTMAAMVIVNNPGDWSNVYAPLLHAPWHGWTPTDLIFPYFLFIVGVSATLSRGTSSWPRILRRSVLIFALGLFLNGFPWFRFDTWRIPGVLQRIAVCYLAATAIVRASMPRRLTLDMASARLDQGDWRLPGRLATWAAGLLVAYWIVMTRIAPPGGVAGDLSPESNLAAALDRALMGGHLWKPRWDPEGLLSTVPAVATTVLGVIAGLWMRSEVRPARKATLLGVAGAVGIGAGLLWGFAFPINKNLWTSSYVLFTGGAAALTLAACYAFIDIGGARGWSRPFVILGSNAILLFVLSGIAGRLLAVARVAGSDGSDVALKTFIYASYYAPLAAPKNASLLYALTHLVVLFGVLAVLYRRRVFVRV